ncbi:TRAM domain-containing protein [Halomonas sp. GXIMD04776]
MLGKRRPARMSRQRISSDSTIESSTKDRTSINRAETSGANPDDAGQYEVDILRLAHDGRGIARNASGKTLFVNQVLPGERVKVAIHRSRKRFDEAHPRELITPSADRISPPCPHYAQCGGCDLQHLALEAQRRHKCDVLIDQLARQGITLSLPPRLLAGKGFGYRRRARLGVKVDAKGRVHLGFRARGSHYLVDIGECPILAPSLSALLGPLRECLDHLQAPRQVGHIELLVGDHGAAVVIRQLRTNLDDAKRWRQWADAHGVALGLLQGRQDPVLEWVGKAPRLSYTPKSGHRDLELYIAPGDFLQINAEINQALVTCALEWLTPHKDERVLDLFAGVGNFSLALAPQVANLLSVEGSLAMVERLRGNARYNDLNNIEARMGDLNQPPPLDSRPHSVVLDPPRGGAETVCRTLAKSEVERILYVSCDPATLSRDALHLVEGGYHITRAAVADMFVQTAHLEAMLLFERSPA